VYSAASTDGRPAAVDLPVQAAAEKKGTSFWLDAFAVNQVRSTMPGQVLLREGHGSRVEGVGGAVPSHGVQTNRHLVEQDSWAVFALGVRVCQMHSGIMTALAPSCEKEGSLGCSSRGGLQRVAQ